MQSNSSTSDRLVAVVVTYNRLDKLKTTLARLLQSPVGDLAALVVVDNASTDGTAAWLATLEDPRLDVQRHAVNRGGAGGFETGMRHAMAAHAPDWMVVMDDDARPDSGALRRFHDLDKQGWDALAAAVYYPDGRICDINRPWVNPFWHRDVFWRTALGGGRDGFHLGPDAYEGQQVRPIDGGSFVGLFVSRAGIEQAGFPDGRLFLYGDDVMYTLGLTQAGGRIGFDPGLRFEHDFSTIGTEDRRFRPLWKSYYHYRNLMMVYRRAAGPVLFWPALCLVVPKWLSKLRYHGGERQAYLRLLRRAVADGLAWRVDMPHAEVLALAGTAPAPVPTGSEYRGDSGPAE